MARKTEMFTGRDASFFKPKVHIFELVLERHPPTKTEEKNDKPGKPKKSMAVEWDAPDVIDVALLMGKAEIAMPLTAAVSADMSDEQREAFENRRISQQYAASVNEIIAAALIHPKVVPDERTPNYLEGEIHMADLKRVPLEERMRFMETIMRESSGVTPFREGQDDEVDDIQPGEDVEQETE